MLSPAKGLLVSRVLDAIRESGAIAVLENNDHPAVITILAGERKYRIIVYIWRLTAGGPEGVRPTGEFRIQITGVTPPLRAERDATTLLLGYEENSGVFAGFNSQRQSWGHSPSIQIRWEAIQAAKADGFGFYRRATGAEGEIAVAFTPENFLAYLEQREELHQTVEQEPAERNKAFVFLESAAAGKQINLDSVGRAGRLSVMRTISQRLGQANFSARVKAVYHNRCAACGLQLEMVEAAHIIPVSNNGDNETRNGLCLCYLHHRAYDSALIGIMPNLSVQIGENRLEMLAARSLVHGLEFFKDNLLEEILLPLRLQDRPTPELLQMGLSMRGFV